MSTTSVHPGLGPTGFGGEGVRIIRVPSDLRLGAAARLIGEHAGDPLLAGQRFLESAAQLRIDLDLMWCSIDERSTDGGGSGGLMHIRQVALAVIGSGRTAMLFVSGAERSARKWPGAAKLRALAGGGIAQANRERIALVHHACAEVAAARADGRPRAVLAQALLEPRETEATQALIGAGFQRLGDLAYLRRPLPRAGPGRSLDQAGNPRWPARLRVRSVEQLLSEGHTPHRIDEWIVSALEASYVDTLDCPELCGMRGMDDVLDSHKSVGVFDPALWWIALDESDVARACLLLAVCPEQDSVELVYLGLDPNVRGLGLGSTLVQFGLRRLYDGSLGAGSATGKPRVEGGGGITCAVDSRNAPAMKLYRRSGFERFGLRVPLVKRLGPLGS